MAVATLERVAIGSEAEAKELFKSKRNTSWTLVGRGLYRSAYLAPSGVIYKIGNDHCNQTEHDNAQRCLAMEPMNVRIPETTLYEFEGGTILAMQFVKGVTYEKSDACGCDGKYCDDCVDLYDSVSKHYGIQDIHESNIIVGDDGYMYLIDLGE